MRILVVCRANVARSPLAAVMLAHELAGVGATVTSAGIQASEGAYPARGSVELAAQRGLDLTGHRSRPLSTKLVVDADLVLTMSENQRDVCARQVAGASRSTFTLRELDRLAAYAGAPPGAGGLDAGPEQLVEAAHLARPTAPPPRGPEDIPDPIGKDWEHWWALADELDALTARLGSRLRRATARG